MFFLKLEIRKSESSRLQQQVSGYFGSQIVQNVFFLAEMRRFHLLVDTRRLEFSIPLVY